MAKRIDPGQSNAEIVLPFPAEPAPKEHRFIGHAISTLGHAVFFFGLACSATALVYVLMLPFSFFAEPEMVRSVILKLPIVLIGVVALPIGAHVVIYGRRLRAKDALKILSKDPRAPVLYLRSFADEDLPDPTFRSPFRPSNLPNPFIPKRYEERLAPVLGKIGPVISIGIPGERRAALGAARVYVRDENWQKAVRHFAEAAGVVLIVVGRTGSLLWEIEFILAHVQRERVLFFFPYADEASERRKYWRKYYEIIPSVTPRGILERSEAERQTRYRLFREKARQQISGTWPEEIGGAQFLDFTEDARPRLLKTKRPVEALVYSLLFPKSVRTWLNVGATLKPFIKKVRRLEGSSRR